MVFGLMVIYTMVVRVHVKLSIMNHWFLVKISSLPVLKFGHLPIKPIYSFMIFLSKLIIKLRERKTVLPFLFLFKPLLAALSASAFFFL